MNVGGGCEAVVTAGKDVSGLGLGCAELLYGRSFPLRLKGALYESCCMAGAFL